MPISSLAGRQPGKGRAPGPLNVPSLQRLQAPTCTLHNMCECTSMNHIAPCAHSWGLRLWLWREVLRRYNLLYRIGGRSWSLHRGHESCRRRGAAGVQLTYVLNCWGLRLWLWWEALRHGNLLYRIGVRSMVLRTRQQASTVVTSHAEEEAGCKVLVFAKAFAQGF